MSYCMRAENIFSYGALYDENGKLYEFSLKNSLKKGFVVHIKGITTCADAQKLNGIKLYAKRENFPPPRDDEFYQADLIGLVVHSQNGDIIGRVVSVLDYGGDVLEIEREGDAPLLVPFTRNNVPEIELDQGYIVIRPLKEL